MKAQKAKKITNKPASKIVIKEQTSKIPIEAELGKARISKEKNVPEANEPILLKDPQYEEMMGAIADNNKVNQLTIEGPKGSSGATVIVPDPPIVISPITLQLLKESKYREEELTKFNVSSEPIPENLLIRNFEIMQIESPEEAAKKDFEGTFNTLREIITLSPERHLEGKMRTVPFF